MPKTDPRRHRSAIINFRVTPAVHRYVRERANEEHETISDFLREAIKLRIEVNRTFRAVAEKMGFRSVETLIWHAVLEYSQRHAADPVEMPAMPEDGDEDAAQQE